MLWQIFDRVRGDLVKEGLLTVPGLFRRLTTQLERAKRPAFDFAVIDEAQDVSVAELRFLAALGGDRPNSLFFAGDLGQRIFQTPFSWRSLGVDVRGRSEILRLNYRSSHQIRRLADRLLPAEVADVDGNTEVRKGAVSAFNGAEPQIRIAPSIEHEIAVVADWLGAALDDGFKPHEIGLFVRSEAELERARTAVRKAGLSASSADGDGIQPKSAVPVGTMHAAKGLEFRAVAVMACDDEILPLQARLEAVADEADLEDVYDTERHLLYVACTRARDRLLITAVEPGSEFLADLDASEREVRGSG